VNNELEGIWEKAVVAEFEELSRNFTSMTEENYETVC
jgi:hypothetical protein